MYSAYVLDEPSRARLLRLVPPRYPHTLATHITHAMRREPAPEASRVEVLGHAHDDARGVQAAVVSVDGRTHRPDGKRYHVTISIDPSLGARPKHSNDLLAGGAFEPFERPHRIDARAALLTEDTSSQAMYHVAPKRVRASIQQRGLDYRVHFGSAAPPRNTRDVTWAPRGNYLDRSIDSARRYARWSGEPHDIWQVDTSGLRLRQDAAWYGGYYTKARVPPRRLRLMTEASLYKIGKQLAPVAHLQPGPAHSAYEKPMHVRHQQWFQTQGNCADIAGRVLATKYGCEPVDYKTIWQHANQLGDETREAMREAADRAPTLPEMRKAVHAAVAARAHHYPYSPSGHYLVLRMKPRVLHRKSNHTFEVGLATTGHVTFEHRKHGELNFGDVHTKAGYPIIGRIPLRPAKKLTEAYTPAEKIAPIGWISPKGEYHGLEPHEIHSDWVERNMHTLPKPWRSEDPAETMWNYMIPSGWIRKAGIGHYHVGSRGDARRVLAHVERHHATHPQAQSLTIDVGVDPDTWKPEETLDHDRATGQTTVTHRHGESVPWGGMASRVKLNEARTYSYSKTAQAVRRTAAKRLAAQAPHIEYDVPCPQCGLKGPAYGGRVRFHGIGGVSCPGSNQRSMECIGDVSKKTKTNEEHMPTHIATAATDLLAGARVTDVLDALLDEGRVLQFRPGAERIAPLGRVGAIPVFRRTPQELRDAHERNQRLLRSKDAERLARLSGTNPGHQCTSCGLLTIDPTPAPGTRAGVGGMIATDCPGCGNRDITPSRS